jgi:hypothetical protein
MQKYDLRKWALWALSRIYSARELGEVYSDYPEPIVVTRLTDKQFLRWLSRAQGGMQQEMQESSKVWLRPKTRLWERSSKSIWDNDEEKDEQAADKQLNIECIWRRFRKTIDWSDC